MSKYNDFPSEQTLNESIDVKSRVWRLHIVINENIFFRIFWIDMIIPKGFECDGNSFPFFLRAFRDPYDIRWLFAGILHDYLYRTQFIPRIISDLIYYYILVETAGKFRAYIFYKWVRLWGWIAWNENGKKLEWFPKAKHDLKTYLINNK